MNTFKKYRFAYMILVTALLLSACLPAGTDVATIDATQAAELIETAVAQALDTQATQIAESVPQATATLAATNTAIPAPPTLTPVPTITPLVLEPTVSSSSGGGSTVITYPDACATNIQKRPYDNTEIRIGDPFDIKFIIKNTGTTTWEAGLDLIYWSGPDMTTAGFPLIELPEMKPGDQFSVGPYDAVAPNDKGFQVMTMKLEGGFCWPYVAIIVK